LAGLAVLQGLTEFLPVSSSGHLALAERLLGFSDPPVLFNVSLHVGTLAAVVWLYRRELARILAAGARWLVRPPRRAGHWRSWTPADDWEGEALGLVVGTAVTAVVGLTFRHPFEAAGGSPVALGALFIACGAVLAATRWAPDGRAAVTPGRAALIGLAQSIAILPALSRSGLTIAAALFLGVERERAARFSFLLSVPAILGAELVGLLSGLSGAAVPVAQHAAGAVLSAVVGVVALRTVVLVVRRRALPWFALYLVPLGIAVLLFVR
ncbi:MAG: undecaprenyl-diphosphate phosphatase, partial [Deltaproteobacteria bacterium]|nr:undecaprenyl-diphosphate phosphatase [Deltaproteobacteria bacterium]